MTQRRTRPLAARLVSGLLAGALIVPLAGEANAFFWRRDPAPQPAPVALPPPEIGPTVPVDVLPPPRPGTVARTPSPAPSSSPTPLASLGDGPLTIVPQAVAPSIARPAPASLAAAPLPPRPPEDLVRIASATVAASSASDATVAAAAPAPSAPAPTPVVTASAAPVSPQPVAAAAPAPVPAPEPIRVAAVTPASDAEVVSAANAYFNGIAALSGRFIQVGSDGRRFAGTLYVDRPGKLRFQYDEPATIDVVADGRSVVVRDRRLGTQDMYPISQTPLKFLLGDRIRLGQDIQVLGVERASDEVDVVLRDSSTFAGSSDIRLTFDPGLETLKEWRIVDAQGFETRVSLTGLQRHARLDPNLFQINYEVFRGGASDTY